MENDLEAAKDDLRKRGRRTVQVERRLVSVRIVYPLILPQQRGADPMLFKPDKRINLEVLADTVLIHDGARTYEVPRSMCILEWETGETAK